ncbi:MAG: DNA polymerase III subunit alpha [Alphaproteobacteria bacterium]|nr:DNA polymerase III subunit alpha [Alphaproteobacteria bacterium]
MITAQEPSSRIAPLNIRTHFTFLRGLMKIPDLIATARRKGYSAVGINDTNNLYGAIDFYETAKTENISPILGVSFFVSGDQFNKKIFPRVSLYARTIDGYHSLLSLVTLAQFNTTPEGMRARKTLPWSDLLTASSCICVLPMYNSPLTHTNAQDLCIEDLQSTFKNNLYLGNTHQRNESDHSSKIFFDTFEEHKIKYNLPSIPFPQIYYAESSDAEALHVLQNIQPISHPFLEEEMHIFDQSMPDASSLLSQYSENEIQSLEKIVTSIDFDLELNKWVFPNPKIKTNITNDPLREKVYAAANLKQLAETQTQKDRLEYELKIIKDKGYDNYFLTVIDLIDFMKQANIATSTRGSAGGSYVAFVTGVTNVNPIEYELPFERFLNPFRPSAPDIDMDVADNRRSEVIEYITKTYGKDKVAQIGTFGTMMARAAVRDTARALGQSFTTGDRIAKLIPMGKQGAPMTIEKALKEVPELVALSKNEPIIEKIINTAKKIEGNARHISIHAAGIVIAPTSLVNYTPLEPDSKDGTHCITQYDMYDIEKAGPLKFDLLGLTNLSILADTITLLQKENIYVDIDSVPLDDEATYKMLSEGRTVGCFQLGGSSGITQTLKRMKPTKLYDIAAVVALYRPGPLKNIDEYIARKNGTAPIKYIHPKMKEYLSKSYGVMVYQDDLLFTALHLAQYNWEEVDVFRKAVGKKIPELMAKQEKIFKERVQKHSGATQTQANALWDLFEPFKGYGFNKAHAMSYAKVAYQTAYLKKHYSAHYMATYLTAIAGDIDEVAKIIHECRAIGLTLLPPDIQKSNNASSVELHNGSLAIRIGFSMIKHLSHSTIEAIIAEREKQAFDSLDDFLIRISKKDPTSINKKSLESLTHVGALDCFEARSVLLHNMPSLLLFAKEGGAQESTQHTLFAPTTFTLKKLTLEKVPREDVMQDLLWEKEYLGVYTTGHPLNLFTLSGLSIEEILNKKGKGQKVYTQVTIEEIKTLRTKKGERMQFLTLEDAKGSRIEAVLFPRTAEQYEDIVALHRPIGIFAETDTRGEELTLKIEKIEELITHQYRRI